MSEGKPRICIDFDDVIHSYDGGWEPGHAKSYIPGGSVPGAKEAIALLREDYEVVVLSSRADTAVGQRAIARWLKEHGIEVDHITDRKVPAIVYVDDRALHFYGDWEETVKDIREFRQWRGR
jgi:hypothetical protein